MMNGFLPTLFVAGVAIGVSGRVFYLRENAAAVSRPLAIGQVVAWIAVIASFSIAFYRSDFMTQMWNETYRLAAAQQPAIVIQPAYKVLIDGKPTPIWGSDACPSNDSLFVNDVTRPSNNCIVMSKDRREVMVNFPGPNGNVIQEVWTVVREDGQDDYGRLFQRSYLKRPDGSPVLVVNL